MVWTCEERAVGLGERCREASLEDGGQLASSQHTQGTSQACLQLFLKSSLGPSTAAAFLHQTRVRRSPGHPKTGQNVKAQMCMKYDKF